MRTQWLLFLLVVCMAACGSDAVPVTPTEVAAPGAAVESQGGLRASAGQSGCYAVKFHVSGNFPTFAVTGDLEGSVVFVFPGPPTLFGVASKISGATAYWTVTGGVLPGVDEFETTFDNTDFVIDRPGSPGTLFENLGKHRALAGVREANLTYKGTFDLLLPSPLSHDYRGVICP